MFAAAAVSAMVLASPTAAGQSDLHSQAAKLFEQGVAARARGQHQEAASRFAAADARSANSAALLAAMKAALLAEDAVLAMQLADRAARDLDDDALGSAAVALRDRFGKRCGRMTVRCTDCTLRIDGAPAAVNLSHWVLVGEHQLLIRHGTRSRDQSVYVNAGRALQVQGAPLRPRMATATEPSTKAREPRGVAAAWFWLSLGATAGFGFATVASAIDAVELHADFVQSPSARAERSGRAAQEQTNALLAVNLGLVALTTTLGITANWSEEAAVEQRGSAQVLPGGLALGVAASF